MKCEWCNKYLKIGDLYIRDEDGDVQCYNCAVERLKKSVRTVLGGDKCGTCQNYCITSHDSGYCDINWRDHNYDDECKCGKYNEGNPQVN